MSGNMKVKVHFDLKFAIQRKCGSIQKFAYQQNLNPTSVSRIIQGWMKPPGIYREKFTQAVGKKIVEDAFGAE